MPRWNYKDWKERFWCKVNKDGPIMPNMDTMCWQWIGGTQTDGYGSLGMNLDGKWSNWPAHRVSWFIHFNFLPKYPDEELCHKCDNRKCVNPDHLFVADHADNIRDMFSKGRNNSACGERNRNSKLTENEVRKIRYLHAWTRITYADLGRMFGVSGEQASMIVNRKTWKSI